MTEAPRDGVKDRILDLVFGKRDPLVTTGQIEASLLPKRVRLAITVLYLASLLLLTLGFLASHGWIPFIPQIARKWSVWAALPTFVTPVIQNLVALHYRRRAKDRMTPTP